MEVWSSHVPLAGPSLGVEGRDGAIVWEEAEDSSGVRLWGICTASCNQGGNTKELGKMVTWSGLQFWKFVLAFDRGRFGEVWDVKNADWSESYSICRWEGTMIWNTSRRGKRPQIRRRERRISKNRLLVWLLRNEVIKRKRHLLVPDWGLVDMGVATHGRKSRQKSYLEIMLRQDGEREREGLEKSGHQVLRWEGLHILHVVVTISMSMLSP